MRSVGISHITPLSNFTHQRKFRDYTDNRTIYTLF